MEVLIYLVPLALALGFLGLLGFLWSLRSGQYEDLDGAAWRAISDDDPPADRPAEPYAPVPTAAGPLAPASSDRVVAQDIEHHEAETQQQVGQQQNP